MIIFISGIHGAGKGTLCRKLSLELNLKHFTASEILKWSEVSPDIKNKNVQDISSTQDRLIRGLDKIKKDNIDFILDGHFTLFDISGNPTRIPFDTFQKIAPSIIAVVTEEITVIKARLEERDDRQYEYETLEFMQNLEVEYAQEVANQLSIPFISINSKKVEALKNLITKRKTNEDIT